MFQLRSCLFTTFTFCLALGYPEGVAASTASSDAAIPSASRIHTFFHLLVWLAFIFAILMSWRSHRKHRNQLKAMDTQLEHHHMRLALWGHGASELFWDYDINSRTLTATFPGTSKDAAWQVFPAQAHPDDKDALLKQLQAFLEVPDSNIVFPHCRIRLPGQNWHSVSARGRVVKRDADGKALQLSGIARDISRQLTSDKAQQVAAEVFQHMNEAVVILDEHFRIISVNDAFIAMIGQSREALQAQPVSGMLSSPRHEDIAQEMHNALNDRGHWSAEQLRLGHNGLLCNVRASSIPGTPGSLGNGTCHLLIFSDITAQHRAEQELYQLANFDALTQLPNRAHFNRKLEEALATHSPADTFAVLFLDLDHFKDINDSLGHALGDQVLHEFSRRLQANIPANAFTARPGGDEFAIILEHITDSTPARQLAEDILRAFSQPLQLQDGMEFTVTPSIGISLYPDHGLSAETLLQHADTAMHRAKSSGRQNYQFYHGDMDEQIIQRLQIINLLHGAIEREELFLMFQPRWSVPHHRFCGVEALLRWRHPELGLVPPSEFIPLAEESGLIVELGNWVADKACQTLAEWKKAGLENIHMAINVSSVQLLREDYPHLVAHSINKYGLCPRTVELEITESVLLDKPHIATERMQALSKLGMRLSIDDFGTGYSSLAYLHNLPVDCLKIDRAFIANASAGSREEAIVVAIITMAHAMHMQAVTEGVETLEQFQLLQKHGCDEIQGYYLSRPLAASDCLALLQSNTPPPGLVPPALH